MFINPASNHKKEAGTILLLRILDHTNKRPCIKSQKAERLVIISQYEPEKLNAFYLRQAGGPCPGACFVVD
jgi:hypothetical protein